MTVILVLLTFAIFLLFEYFRRATQAFEGRATHTANPQMLPRLPSLVSGFEVPANLHYHLGHTWALSEGPTLVRVGMDDFASKLVGKIERIALPQRGQWIRQGQKIWTMFRDGKSVDMLSPIEGIVADINEAATREPERARKDPYGEGWFVTVHSPDAKINFRNLLGGALARLWMEHSARRLQQSVPFPMAALSQDGGVAVDDIARNMPDQDWVALATEFFLP